MFSVARLSYCNEARRVGLLHKSKELDFFLWKRRKGEVKRCIFMEEEEGGSEALYFDGRGGRGK